jgi:peptidoglycan/LPS O-acetylase OafA/YrhL
MTTAFQEDLALKTPKSAKQESYRPDIDGLRALAVLLVVVFHTAAKLCPGGFIGVDVFFVISGYLITGIVARDIEQNRFSLSGFYERRIRRIVPALFVLLFACSAASYFVFLPQDLVQYAKSLIAAVLSYSNFFFWTQAGYFKPAYAQVLLHTWSLAVEEQFYLLLPLTLIVLARYPRFLRPALITATGISFVISVWLAFKNPDAAFYMPASRAWELLTGSLLALRIVRLPNSRSAQEFLAGSGLLMIAWAAARFSSFTPFPGFAALLPCVGSALLLATGQGSGTLTSSLLSLRPAVSIGAISYSVYLWHWPLVLFVKSGALPEIKTRGPFYVISILLLSLLLGWLSWRFVEQPFRVGRWKKLNRPSLFRWAAIGACALFAVAGSYLFAAGLPSRFPARAIRVAGYLNTHENMRVGTCFITSANRFSDYNPALCTAPTDPARLSRYFLIGDSHAAALWFSLQRALPHANIMQATASGCAPALGNYDNSDCGQLRRFIFETYLPQHSVDGVIMTKKWAAEQDADKLESAIVWLKQHRIPVTLIGPVPEYDAPLPMLLALSIKRGDPGLAHRHLLSSFAELDRSLQTRAANWQVPYLSAWQAMCRDAHCDEYADPEQNIPALVDMDHLSNQEATNVVTHWIDRDLIRTELRK